MTQIQKAICKVIRDNGGWPKCQLVANKVTYALNRAAEMSANINWHSAQVDDYSVTYVEYKEWEQGL